MPFKRNALINSEVIYNSPNNKAFETNGTRPKEITENTGVKMKGAGLSRDAEFSAD